MNTYSKFIIIFLIFLVTGCVNTTSQRKPDKYEKKLHNSLGFALIFSDNSFNEKIVNKKLNNLEPGVMHSFLKKNTSVRIINPTNSKFINTYVVKNADYPKIFNVVINKITAEILDLDSDNPYIEIIELKKNKKFIAKEANIFEEEKSVAEKAPVNEIKIDDMSINKSETTPKNKKNYTYILVISDFYYEESAIKLQQHLISNTKRKNFFIKKISDKQYRLSAGPFINFNALKTSYISLNNLGFEDLNIHRE